MQEEILKTLQSHYQMSYEMKVEQWHVNAGS